jgi:hypothetical protein
MLDVSFSSKFDWAPELLEKKVLKVDLGLFKNAFQFDDQIRFQAMGNVLESLCQKAPACEKIILYQGPLGWNQMQPLCLSLKNRMEEWGLDLYETKVLSAHQETLFAVNVLTEYLHRIASFAPDTIQFSVFFTDLETFEPPHLAQLLSKNRFTHFEIENDPFEGNVGIILPKDELVDENVLKKIGDVLQKHGQNVRCIPEEMIPQMWHELEKLYAVEGKVSRFGMRGIQGFEAAEGEVVFI